MRLILANPRGFCAGVNRAIDIVERVLSLYAGIPVYVRHQVVHNAYVVETLRQRGAIFVTELDAIPDNSIVIFSAHGVAQATMDAAKSRSMQVFDATCPLVTKVHIEVSTYARKGMDCVLIGHHGHPEVAGTMGRFDSSYGGQIHLVESVADVGLLDVVNPKGVGYVSQTTLSVDDTAQIIAALRDTYPAVAAPHKNDICYATQNRQDIVRKMAQYCDVLLVVGSTNSSNSNRLSELASRCGARGYLIDSAAMINPEWFYDCNSIGLTAGASAPDVLVEQVQSSIMRQFPNITVEQVNGEPEQVVFKIPHILQNVITKDSLVQVAG